MTLSRRALLKGALFAGAAAAVTPERAEAREAKVSPDTAVGLLYDSTRCVGCNGCVIACKDANDLPWEGLPAELSYKTKNIIQKTSVPGAEAGAPSIQTHVKRQCMHCVDPPCASACMLGALHKEGAGKRDMGGEKQGTGIVVWDKALCVGCRYCQIACPYAIPKFEWFSANPRIIKCELCHQRADPNATGPESVANPACAEVCPAEAVVYGRRAELLEDAKQRIAASPDAYNPRIFGESEGGGTGVLYLTAKGVDFGQLGFPHLPDYSNAFISENVSHAPYLHGLTPLALYTVAALVVRRNKSKEEEEPKEAASKADERSPR